MGVRVIVRRRTIAQVKKGMRDLQKQGYVPVMKEPVRDEGNLYWTKEAYVMVMEHPTRKATRANKW